jgi:hypothetical protein
VPAGSLNRVAISMAIRPTPNPMIAPHCVSARSLRSDSTFTL